MTRPIMVQIIFLFIYDYKYILYPLKHKLDFSLVINNYLIATGNMALTKGFLTY